MILILTDKFDIHATKVQKLIESQSIDVIRLNLDVPSLKKTHVTYEGNGWVIKTKNGSFRTSEIKAVWNRRTYVELMLEDYDNTNTDFKIWRGEWNKTLLGIYTLIPSHRWLNFYRDAYFAENKYHQMMIASNLGFMIPPFICSNKKRFLQEFIKTHEQVVIKFMNQDFYKIGTNYVGLYVNKITLTALKEFQNKDENPIFLQKYIEKDFEVRYTVVGSDHFICKIESQLSEVANIDWRRYDIPHTPHSIITAPEEIKRKITRFMNYYNLNYGAFDFIVTKEQEWYFLELNSMGQFLWIEDLSGLSISKSIANWLIYINNKN